MKPFSESDRRLIRQIAETWVESGGDREGFSWLQDAIADEIDSVIEEKEGGAE